MLKMCAYDLPADLLLLNPWILKSFPTHFSCSFLFFFHFIFPCSSPAVMSCEAATQTEVGPGTAVTSGPEAEHPVVTLRRGRGHRRPRPSSMVDYQSYRDTKLLVARFLQQQSPCSLMPEVQELINSIKSVLRSDQEHMEEAVRCATFIQQVTQYGFVTMQLVCLFT